MPKNSTKDTIASVATSLDEGTFRGFIENLPVMFYAVGPTPPHRPLYISPTFDRFGYPMNEWLTDPDIWDRVIHVEDRDRVLKATRSAMKKGESVDFEYRAVCRDGEIVWVRDRSCFIYDSNGEKVCWQGVILDITKRVVIEEELSRRESLYHTLASHIKRNDVMLFDRDLRYTLAEGERLRLGRYKREDYVGKTLYEGFPAEAVEYWEPLYLRTLAGEESSFEYENEHGFFHVDLQPVRDERGETFAGMVMWEEITERKRAEAALRESEARYRQLFENANDIIYVHDLEGNYISINQAGERIFGYTRDEVLSLNMSTVVAPEHVEMVKHQLDRKVAGDIEQTVYEVDCLRKDGSRATLEVNSSVVLQDGKPVAVQGIARDITERKATEQALRRSEENLAAAQRITHLGSWELEILDVNDSTKNVITCSDEVYRIFGYDPQAVDVSTEFVYRALHEDDLDNVSKAFSHAVNERSFLDIESRIVLPSGEIRLVNAKAETVYSETDNSPVKMIGTIQDITERHNSEEAVKQSEARFRDLFENANDLIYTHDLNGNFTSLNRAGELITGYSREEAMTMNITQVVAPEFLRPTRTITARGSSGLDKPRTYEIEIIAKHGNRVALEISTRMIVIDGLPAGVQGIGRDISERRNAESSLHRALSLLTSTFESTADGIVVMSLDREIVTCNRKFVEMWGIDDSIIEGKSGERLIAVLCEQIKDSEEFRRQLEDVYSDPEAIATATLELKDGRIFERYSQPQYLEGKAVGRVACFRDITERKYAEEKLRHYALHDTLTELPNRAAFMDHLRQAVERAGSSDYSKFAVLFLDLDRFKVINDSLGHAVGDKLLIAIASRLTSCVRPGDVVARLGGDEFTILLNRSGGLDEVIGVAERLQARISEPFKIDNYEVFTTASIGIIASGGAAREAEEYLRDADAAMYRAKEAGKARHEVFDQEMHVRNMNLLQVETDLRHAVDRGEFEVLYQPIIDMRTGSVTEFEALIRWRHPVHGLVGPDEFIHVAEETGLIIQIGKWIIEESCRQVAEWQRTCGNRLSVSVNLSAKQLMHPNLTMQVAEILLETGLEPIQLKLEVTESTVMEHSERSLKVLSDLDRLGISLSTDDFGTGYSSLSYLQRFPFERLKIDRSFINVMDSEEKSGAIVKTILMLGENLGIEVVAEGIETVSQLEKLRSLGCTMGQGYLFSRPIDRESASAFLDAGGNIFADNPALAFRNPTPMIEVNDIQ